MTPGKKLKWTVRAQKPSGCEGHGEHECSDQGSGGTMRGQQQKRACSGSRGSSGPDSRTPTSLKRARLQRPCVTLCSLSPIRSSPPLPEDNSSSPETKHSLSTADSHFLQLSKTLGQISITRNPTYLI